MQQPTAAYLRVVGHESGAQGEKIKCLSEDLTHLKLVHNDKHALKNFDRELEKRNRQLAKCVGIETALPARCAFTPGKAILCMRGQE
jgi:ferritin heavy chain